MLLRHDLFAGAYELLVSRLDLYGDFQGWVPVLEDLDRFVGYGSNRRGFEERNEAFTTSDWLTGLTFGRDALVGRLRQDPGDPPAWCELASRPLGC